MKRCSRCKKSKILDKFCKRSASSDGYNRWCRECCRVWQKEYRRICNNNPAFVIQRRIKTLNRHNKKYKTLVGYLRHVFHKMKTRCDNPDDADYSRYGGIGIKCLFKNADEFIDYVINDLKYNTLAKLGGLRLAQIDKTGNYEWGNICFKTTSQCSHGNRKQRTAMWGECSSIYKGVSRDNERNTWKAYIKMNGKQKYLGRFDSQLDAARAYDKAALEYFGEFALTNAMMGLL